MDGRWRRYDSDSELRHPHRLLSAMLHDGAAAWELAGFLLQRSLKSQYRQSVLGYLWIVLPSLATTLVFVFLAKENILQSRINGRDYLLFVLAGTMIWQTFSDAVNGPLRCVSAAKNMLVKVNFPREALMLAGIGEVLLYSAVRMVILWTVMLCLQIPLPDDVWRGGIALLLLASLGWSIGLLVLPWGLLYRDGEMGMSLLLAGWFLLTPVVYDGAGIAGNPVTPLLLTARRFMAGGTAGEDTGLLVAAILCGSLIMGGWVGFRLMIPHVVKRLTA